MGRKQIREAFIQAALKRPNGLKAVAESMIQPLRKFRDYEGIGRTAILTQTLGQGQDPLLDVDITQDVAYEVADLGGDVLTLINPETIRPNLKEVVSNPEISYVQMAARKFDIKARVEQYARAEILRVEDRMIINGLLAASTHEYHKPVFQRSKTRTAPLTIGNGQKVTIAGNPVNTPITVSAANLNIAAISAAMSQIDRHGGLKPTNLYMNAANNSVLRAMNANNQQGFFVDFDTSNKIMSKGFIATVYGLNVIVSPEIPLDRIIITAEPEYVGRLIERIPLTVLPYEDAKNRRSGFSLFEEIGVVIHNPAAVCAIKITD